MTYTAIGLPSGFRDLLFEDAEVRRRIENEFCSVCAEAGYREIRPSSIEYWDVYGRGNHGLRERAIRFLDRDDNLLALRADFTTAIGRIAGSRGGALPRPLKVWYSGSVFRKAEPHRGQFYEFSQIGAELIGVNTVERDAEILDIALRSLVKVGIKDACVHVNHAGIFRGIVRGLSLDNSALGEVRTAIDRKDMRTLSARLEELSVQGTVLSQLATLSRCMGGSRALTAAASTLTNEESLSAVEDLRCLAALMREWEGRIVFDLTEIDEMEYYTGPMFTFLSPSHTAELGRGGRYDSLLKEFGADIPAVGFSLSLDNLCACL